MRFKIDLFPLEKVFARSDIEIEWIRTAKNICQASVTRGDKVLEITYIVRRGGVGSKLIFELKSATGEALEEDDIRSAEDAIEALLSLKPTPDAIDSKNNPLNSTAKTPNNKKLRQAKVMNSRV